MLSAQRNRGARALCRRVFRKAAASAVLASAALLLNAAPAHAFRDEGIDVSQWQGPIDWTMVAKPKAQGGGGKKFAFIRSTRGGTGGDPLRRDIYAERIDDPNFTTNITQAKATGMLVGAYHFARIDMPWYQDLV